MADEGSFLRAILANPADDLPRLVYADWLDEQQTEESTRKAEFIRLQHSTGKQHRPSRARIRELGDELPAGWLAAVSHAAVENCEVGRTLVHNWQRRRPLDTVEFAYECPKDWAAMTPTADDRVRHCSKCQRDVYYCETVGEARLRAWQGECVAVSLALARSKGDLNRPRPMLAGVIAPSHWDQADEEKGEGTG